MKRQLLVLALLVFSAQLANSATQSKNVSVIQKWTRFDYSFKSSVGYPNPLQDAALTVVFTSPSGKSNQVHGFWDGGKTWRVRVAPDEVGRWSFTTSCSDPSNRGLHNQAGQFICTAPAALNRFQQHGPLQLARDHRHFEHTDGTPFFWLADTIWNAPRIAAPKDLSLYASTRSVQKFSVAQWSVAPGKDAQGEAAWTGTSRISLNPAFFQRLDAKLEILSRAGLLSAIAPLNELDLQPASAHASPRPPALPDDQATLLLRYLVARWNAEPIAWLLLFEGDGQGRQAARWKKIGQTVFGAGSHAPVILFTGDTPWLLNEFRNEPWVDALAFQTLTDTSDDAAKWAVSGPLSTEWRTEPPHPLVAFTPAENAPVPNSPARFSADHVRKAAWWSLLLAPLAGVSYSAHGVLNWDSSTDPVEMKTQAVALPLWHKSLFLPAARQMTLLVREMESFNYWQLGPRPEFIATQPGNGSPSRYVVAAGTDAHDLSLAYVPSDRTLDLALAALPTSPSVTWWNPRTGQTNSAVAVVGAQSCQFPTPDPGDWLLLMKARK